MKRLPKLSWRARGSGGTCTAEVDHTIRGYRVKPKVPVQFAVSGPEGSNPYGVMDLFRRGHLLGPALSCPGLAAFDSGDPKRCRRSEGLETRADDIA